MHDALAKAERELEQAEELVSLQVVVCEELKVCGQPTESALQVLAELERLAAAAQRKYDFLLVNLPRESD